MTGIPFLITTAVLFLMIGALWMTFFWRVLDPVLRRGLGKLLGVSIHRGEQHIWQINDEPLESTNWRNIFVRPIQMIAMMSAGLIPLVITLIIVLKMFGTGQPK